MHNLQNVYNNFQKTASIEKQASGFAKFLQKGINKIAPNVGLHRADDFINNRSGNVFKDSFAGKFRQGLTRNLIEGSNPTLPAFQKPDITGLLPRLGFSMGSNPGKYLAGLGAGVPTGATTLEALHNNLMLDPNANMEDYLSSKSPFDWIGLGAGDEDRAKVQKAIKDGQGFFGFGRENSADSFNALEDVTKGLSSEQMSQYTDNLKGLLGDNVTTQLGDEGFLNTIRYWLSKYLLGPMGMDNYANDFNANVSQNINLPQVIRNAAQTKA